MSICEPADVHTRALKLLNDNDTKELEGLIEREGAALLEHQYEDRLMNLLQIACSQVIRPECVRILLRCGSDPNATNSHSKKTPLHLAIEHANPEIVEILLKSPKINVNYKPDGRTPLNFLVQNYGKGGAEDMALRCATLLLDNPLTDINLPDSLQKPPIFYAAKKRQKKLVELLINARYKDIDIDTYKDATKKSARDLIITHDLYPSNQLPPVHTDVKSVTERLFNSIISKNENAFIALLNNNKDLSNLDDDCKTLLQYASTAGLSLAVDKLLEYGADVNKTTVSNKQRPIELALLNNHSNVFEKLLAKETDVDKLLVDAVRLDRFQCFESILSHSLPNVNYVQNGYTALHHAAKKNPEYASQLLKKGASLATKSDYNILTICDQSPVVLESHLNDCIKCDTSQSIDDEKFTVTFDYSTLLPPEFLDIKNKDEEDPCLGQKNLVPETQALLYMSQTPEMRHLLNHPIITSFINLKWQQIKILFYLNALFYIAFWLSLIIYILYGYIIPPLSASPDAVTAANISRILLSTTAVALLIRELFQMFVFGVKYFLDPVNWIEMLCIVVTFTILFADASAVTRKQLSSVVIVTSSMVLILLFGQHPRCSTHVCMFKTVSWSFFKLIAWYFILILAFALSFFILFRDIEKDDGEQHFFLKPGDSLFKTIVMLTGEFDASDINFNTLPGISHLIFVLFVFTVAIVLFNLLNGLAISDTQQIKQEAEQVGHVARVKYLAHTEQILLSNLLPKQLCCLTFRCIPLAFIAPTVLLQKREVSFRLRDGKLLDVEGAKHMPLKGRRIYTAAQVDPKTLKETRSLVQKKMSAARRKTEVSDSELLRRIEQRLLQLEGKIVEADEFVKLK